MVLRDVRLGMRECASRFSYSLYWDQTKSSVDQDIHVFFLGTLTFALNWDSWSWLNAPLRRGVHGVMSSKDTWSEGTKARRWMQN